MKESKKEAKLRFLLNKIVGFVNEDSEQELHRSFAESCFASMACGFLYYPQELAEYLSHPKGSMGSMEREKILTLKAAAVQKELLKNIYVMFPQAAPRPWEQPRQPRPPGYGYYSTGKGIFYNEKGDNKTDMNLPNGVLIEFCDQDETDEDNQDLVRILMYVMFFLDIKGVRRCPGCGEVFVINKSLKQKYCSTVKSRCRESFRRATMSPKDKHKYKMKRSETYNQKKEDNDGGSSQRKG